MVQRNCLVLPLALLADAQQDPNQACLNATASHCAGTFQDAISEYQACLKGHPDVPELRSDFGAALALLVIKMHLTGRSSVGTRDHTGSTKIG